MDNFTAEATSNSKNIKPVAFGLREFEGISQTVS